MSPSRPDRARANKHYIIAPSERIEALVEIDGVPFAVEVRRQKEPLGVQQVSDHPVRAFARDGTDAVLIATSGFTPPAVSICKDALAQEKVILCELCEFVRLVEQDGDLKGLFIDKIAAAVVDGNLFFRPLD